VRLGAAALVFAACSFDHGSAVPPAGTCTPPPGWWNPAYHVRARIDTGGAPTGYTIALDDTPLQRFFMGEGYVDAQVVVDHTTVIDRVFEGGRMYVKVPAEGELWIYAASSAIELHEDLNNVFLFATNFSDELPLDQFDLQPPGDWSVVTYDLGIAGRQHVLRVTGPGRHPGAIENLALTDGEISAGVRFLAGTGQQHNGLAVRGNSLQPATMDGFVGQLQADIQHARIAEYTNGVSPPAELSIMDRTIMRDRMYGLTLRFVGDVLTLSIDGEVALTTTMAGADGNLLGLFAHDCDVEFGYVRVRPAMDPEPLATLGPEERYCD
jgi:hypothetical protein